MNKSSKPCFNTDIDCSLFYDCSQCEKEYHKGEVCVYKNITCVEGFCNRCSIPITCIVCGKTDRQTVHIVEYFGERQPYCDDSSECVQRGADRIVEQNIKKGKNNGR
jgi:hypothetical protein